jgi:hypothetical protein
MIAKQDLFDIRANMLVGPPSRSPGKAPAKGRRNVIQVCEQVTPGDITYL